MSPKTRVLWLCVDEDFVIRAELACVFLTQYMRVTDKETNGRTCQR